MARGKGTGARGSGCLSGVGGGVEPKKTEIGGGEVRVKIRGVGSCGEGGEMVVCQGGGGHGEGSSGEWQWLFVRGKWGGGGDKDLCRGRGSVCQGGVEQDWNQCVGGVGVERGGRGGEGR